jgi:hypothetical protein
MVHINKLLSLGEPTTCGENRAKISISHLASFSKLKTKSSTNMMSYDWNSHRNEQDQILLDPLLLDFPNAEIDAQYSLNLQGTQNLVNSRQDQDSVLNTDLSSWPWPEETVSPKGPSAQGFSRQDVDQSQEQCHDQNTEQTIEHAVKEIHQRMKNLEDRMEKRITEIEGQVNDSQNG